MEVEVREVSNKKEYRDFLNVINYVNKEYANFIPPLQQNVKNVLSLKKNPYWQSASAKLFVAYQGSEPVGRIAAIYNKNHQKLYKDGCGYFGYLDCINNNDVFANLIKFAINYLGKFQCKKIIGPLNPSINYELGVLTKGFERKPFFMMNYNAPYYAELLENFGFSDEMKFYAYEVPCNLNKTKIERISRLIRNKYSITIKELDFSGFDAEIKELCKIYNDAFDGHWGFLPFSEEEFQFVAGDMKMIMNKRLIFKILVDDEVAGFILALPNLNEVIEKLKEGKFTFTGLIKFLYFRRKVKMVKVMVVAIRKKYQHLGLGSVLYSEMANRVKQGNYNGGELSWVASSNITMNKVIRSMDAKITKEYKVYAKDILNSGI